MFGEPNFLTPTIMSTLGANSKEIYITTSDGSMPPADSGSAVLSIGSCTFENSFTGEEAECWMAEVLSEGGDGSQTWDESAIEHKLMNTGFFETDSHLGSFEYLVQSSALTVGEVATNLVEPLESVGFSVRIAGDIDDHPIRSERHVL